MRSATEGSGDNKGLSEKMDSEEKEQILDVAGHRDSRFFSSVLAFGWGQSKKVLLVFVGHTVGSGMGG